MRKIKFRGKRLDNGEYIFGDLINWKGGEMSICPMSDCVDIQVDPESVAQFVGYDENGAEVYEGDILDSNEFAMESLAIFDILPDIGGDESRPNTFRCWVLKGTN